MTPDSIIEQDGGMTPPAEFTYNGHKVEIVPPNTEHLIGNFWQIKIDGVIRGNISLAQRERRGRRGDKIDRFRIVSLKRTRSPSNREAISFLLRIWILSKSVPSFTFKGWIWRKVGQRFRHQKTDS